MSFGELRVSSLDTSEKKAVSLERESQNAVVTPPSSLQRRRDAKLVQRINSGDPDAFEELHTLYRERVYRFALKRLRDASEADDVCQDTFLQLYRCIGTFEGRSSLLTWIFGVAYHQICRRFRRRSLEDLSLDAPEAAEARAESVPADRRLDAARAQRECGRVLSERINESQREVFNLRYASNYSTRDIATQLGKSTQAVKISLFRTRRALAQNNQNLAQVLSA
jgi:RNA polymerase sigma-70 factor (ECF subfamily)